MIIVQVAGGLGNQLQQYALYRKLVSIGKEAKLDISWFTQTGRQDGVYARRKLELDYFTGISYEICSEEEKQALIGDGSLISRVRGKLFPASKKLFQESDMYHPQILEFEDMYLCGYFACEKYYADILQQLRRELVFPPSSNEENRKLAERMRKEMSVSVHIRRGDYLDAENAAMFGNICTDAYYGSAVAQLKKIHPDAKFYLFSDDIPYVREKYQGEEYTVVDINKGQDSFYDIWLMSNCKHNICANSTFSFWGARLNGNEGKQMLRPSIHKNTQSFESERMHELWKGWRFIDPAGNVV